VIVLYSVDNVPLIPSFHKADAREGTAARGSWSFELKETLWEPSTFFVTRGALVFSRPASAEALRGVLEGKDPGLTGKIDPDVFKLSPCLEDCARVGELCVLEIGLTARLVPLLDPCEEERTTSSWKPSRLQTPLHACERANFRIPSSPMFPLPNPFPSIV
jgi:hypothetical protein